MSFVTGCHFVGHPTPELDAEGAAHEQTAGTREASGSQAGVPVGKHRRSRLKPSEASRRRDPLALVMLGPPFQQHPCPTTRTCFPGRGVLQKGLLVSGRAVATILTLSQCAGSLGALPVQPPHFSVEGF